MPRRPTRDQIVEEADRLFYTQGYEHTSFADIAAAVKISRGNFYYHFKTKDEILDAVIQLRMKNTAALLKNWEDNGNTPYERIKSFIQILIVNQTKIMAFGCPLGTLTSELAKLQHGSQAEANKLFTMFREWLRKQFVLLGCKSDADELALHVLARSQGVATLANAFRNESFIKQEVEQMIKWLDACTEQAA